MAIEQEDINSIHSQYPWASEDTLGKIASNKRVENDKLKKVFKELTGNEFNYDDIKKALEDAKDSFTTANKLAIGLEARSTKLFSGLSSSRDIDPLVATAELMNMATGAIDDVVGSVTQYTKFLPGWGSVVSLVAGATTGLMVTAAGVGAIFAKIMSEQEKALRTIINYGGVVGDLTQYTKMRDTVAGVGMSMQEMAKLMVGNKAMLANLPGDLVATTIQFAEFAVTVEDTNKKTMGSFGYGVEQQTARLLEEANLMYMSGKLEQFSQSSKDKIRKNFESSSTMTTFLAEKFGDQRSSLLALRNEALTNVDFMSALARNGEYLAEKYGENAEENVKASSGVMKMLFTKVLGPQFGEKSEQVLNNFIKDIQIDASVLNNMPKEMIDTLSLLGPTVLEDFKNIMEKSGTGQLTKNQTVIAVQKLTKSMANAKPRFGDDPIVLAHNELIAKARTAPDAFIDMTESTLAAGLDSVRALAAQASGSIEAIDDARVAFRTIVSSLEPDIEDSTVALGYFSGALGLVIEGLKLTGMIPREGLPPKPTEPLDKEELSTMFEDVLGPDTGPGYDVNATTTEQGDSSDTILKTNPYLTTRRGNSHPSAAGQFSNLENIGKNKNVVTNLVDIASNSKPVKARISKGKGFGANNKKTPSNNTGVSPTANVSEPISDISSNTNAAHVVKKRNQPIGSVNIEPSLPMIAPAVKTTAPAVKTTAPAAPNNRRTPVAVSSASKFTNTKMSVHLAIMSVLENKIMGYMKDITEETEQAALTENIHGQ
jgi:hypothetical protein